MFVTIITDCRCANARVRQLSRVATLFDVTPTFCPVFSDIEAAGNLIDVLDSTGGQEGIVMVNVAPRNGKSKQWVNGSPFCYFFVKKTLVISTIEGYTLSLIKKLKFIDEVNIVDIPQIIDWLSVQKNITDNFIYTIQHTQFRSFDYVPYLAQWLWSKKHVPSEMYSVSQIEDIGARVWWIDNFGNCKTSVFVDTRRSIMPEFIETTWGVLPVYLNLKDVPDKITACIIGSSGRELNRFVEIIVQGMSAAQRYDISIGDDCGFQNVRD